LYLKDVRVVLNGICIGIFLTVIRQGLGITTQPPRFPQPCTHLYSKPAVPHPRHSGHVAANGTPGTAIQVALNNKEFLCITHTVEYNYISSSSALELQLHVSALYVGHLQVVT